MSVRGGGMKLYVVIKIGADSTDRIKTTWQNTPRVFGAICSAGTLFTRHLSLTYPLFYLISILLSGLIMLGRSLKWIVTCTLIGVAMNTVSVQAHNTGIETAYFKKRKSLVILVPIVSNGALLVRLHPDKIVSDSEIIIIRRTKQN